MAVVDASVYVALSNANEPSHAASRAWLQQTILTGEPVRAPSILLAEVAAALSRGAGNPQLATRTVQHLLQSHLIDLVPVTTHLAERAAIIALTHQVRGCDAIYLALAAEHGETLVTLDRQQLARGGAVAPTRLP